MAEKKYVFLYDGCVWHLEIASENVLGEYLKKIWDARHEALLDSLERRDKGLHPTDDLVNFLDILARMRGTDLAYEFAALKKRQSDDMAGMLCSGHVLYANPAGGYSINLKAENRLESESMDWPVFCEDDIRIRAFPGGRHYYAYIGPVQVKEGGALKWDSESHARAAAMRYVNRKGE